MGTSPSISPGHKTEKQHVENTFAFENRFENRPENSTSAINAVRVEEVPAFVRDFFAFDGFRLLYMEFPEDDPETMGTTSDRVR